LEDDVYEEISDRCNDNLECMFYEMIGVWIDKPDYKFNDNYYSPDINNRHFNELLQEQLDEIRVEEINESKIVIKNMLRESLVVEFYGKKIIEPITKRFNDSSDDMINKLAIAICSNNLLVILCNIKPNNNLMKHLTSGMIRY
jgi:hypothetical protein